MMYYIAKLFQAAGLTIIFTDFALNYPQLMSRTTLGIGIIFFLSGWIIQNFLLKGNRP